jgi:hypothetical protein
VASAARRAYAASVAAAADKAVASAVRHARAAIAALPTAEADEINDGAYNKGSLDNKAEASAARRTYAAHAASDDDEASASAARRARAAIVAQRKAGGGDIDDGAFNEGSDNDEAAESAARREYASAASDNDEALAPAARRVRAASAARGTAVGGYIVDGTCNEGSNNNKAAESAARHAYASAASDEDEASAPAARHVRAASAARGTAKGGYVVDGTSDEGSDDDEAKASAARGAYVASTASNNDEAVATAERRLCAAMAARHADGGRLRQRCPSGRKATASAARRTRTTKVARRTGVNEAASDAKGDDVASRDDDSEVDANYDTDNNTERAGQPKKVGEYGGRGVRAATAPSDSDDDPDSSVNAAATPRATDKANKATRDGAWRGCAASAHKSAGRQAKARAAHHDHGTDDNDYDVDAAGGRKSEANPMKNRASVEALPKFSFSSAAATNPTKNRATAEALPKFSSSSAASANPTKNRANAEALPKFPSTASARSSEGEEPLDDARMTNLGQNMSVHGTTAARCARRAQKEEAAPGWKANGKGNPKSNHYAISKANRVEESGGEAHAESDWGGGKDPRGARNNPMKYRARQTLAAPGIVSFDARSSATRRASAALVNHGRDASTRRTLAPAQGGDDSEVETVGKYDPSGDEGASNTAKGLGPAALAAAPAMFEGLLSARARRKVHTAPRGNAYKKLGQGDDDGGTGIVVTQVVDGQITGHEAPKKRGVSGLQAAQATGNAANHPA